MHEGRLGQLMQQVVHAEAVSRQKVAVPKSPVEPLEPVGLFLVDAQKQAVDFATPHIVNGVHLLYRSFTYILKKLHSIGIDLKMD